MQQSALTSQPGGVSYHDRRTAVVLLPDFPLLGFKDAYDVTQIRRETVIEPAPGKPIKGGVQNFSELNFQVSLEPVSLLQCS